MRRYIFLFKLALLNTFRKRLRASLAIGSIVFSAGVMVVFFGISDGLKSLVLGQVTNSDLRDVVTVQPRDARQIALDQETLSKVRSVNGVTVLEQSAAMVGRLTYHGISLDAPLYGVSDNYFDLVTVNTMRGDMHSALRTGQRTIVVSSATLEVYDMSAADAVGKQITLSVQVPSSLASKQADETHTYELTTYKIAAVIDKGNAAAAYIPLDALTALGVDQISQAKIRVNSIEKVGAVRESIERMGFQTVSVLDSIEQVNRIFGLVQRILLFFGVVSLVVTVFGAFNTITLTLLEQTPQVGFLRLLGMHRRDVGFIFITQSILLTSIGALLGLVAGVLTGGLINGAIRALVDDSLFGAGVYIFQIPVTQSIIILMLSILLGWLVGVMPAKRAVLINPLDALHS